MLLLRRKVCLHLGVDLARSRQVEALLAVARTAAMVIRTALNRTPANLELWATYLVPGQPGTPARIDAASPGTCPFSSHGSTSG